MNSTKSPPRLHLQNLAADFFLPSSLLRRDQFERELRIRQGAGTSTSAGSTLAAPAAAGDEDRSPRGSTCGAGAGASEGLDERFVLPIIRTHELDPEDAFVGTDWSRYPFVLVMQRAEEDLAGAIAHARMGIEAARDVARSLGSCLAHLHDRGLVHGASRLCCARQLLRMLSFCVQIHPALDLNPLASSDSPNRMSLQYVVCMPKRRGLQASERSPDSRGRRRRPHRCSRVVEAH